jgi:cytochrome c biogenesis protein CcdA
MLCVKSEARDNYLYAKGKKNGGFMKQRNLKYIGIALIVGGIMLFFDGLGSLILPVNYHDFWFDLERVFRIIGSFLLIILGVHFVKETI